MVTPGLKARQLRKELDRVETELSRLRAMSDEAIPDDHTPFDRYLEVLEEKCDEVSGQLGEIDPNCEVDMDVVTAGLEEARQRLAIATQAADARFG
jgi:hypothetical protein